jgi:YjbE family integral membrane protein
MKEKRNIMFDWLGPAIGIVLLDLVLSGDNAVVIGAAAAGLPKNRRLLAIVFGGGGAVVLRILFALAATLLLNVHYLGIIGGIILLFIGARLLLDRSKNQQEKYKEALEHKNQEYYSGSLDSKPPVSKKQRGFLSAIFTILIADVTMSLDNVLAVAGLAKETPLLLVGGLLLSIAILLVGSALVASLIDRFPWVLDIACLVVAWTAAHVFLGDEALKGFVEQHPWLQFVVIAVALLSVVLVDGYLFFRDRPKRPEAA